MIFNKDRPIYKLNLKKELKNKKEKIVRDILKAKDEAGNYRAMAYNFEIFSLYNAYLYELFMEKSKK